MGLARKSMATGIKSAKNVRLLIVENTLTACELLKESLNRSTIGIGEVFCFHSYSQAIEFGWERKADVALVGEHLDGGRQDGLAVIQSLREKSPLTRSIFLARSLPPAKVVAAFQSGARGIFCRTQPIQSLRRCVQAVYEGRGWISSEQLEAVLETFGRLHPRHQPSAPILGSLTKREEEVVSLVIEGLSSLQIAHRLGISEGTVSNCLVECYEKLELSTRVKLVLSMLSRTECDSHLYSVRTAIQ
jgi:two-component system, NarL family, response regulator NreC